MAKPKRESPLTAVVLATGEDAFESQTPKQLHPLLGRPIGRYALDLCAALGVAKAVVVTTSKRHQEALTALGDVTVVRSRGTSQARQCAAGLEALRGPARGLVLVIPADQPLLEPATLQALVDETRARGASLGLLTVLAASGDQAACIERDAAGEVRGLRRGDALVHRPEGDALIVSDDDSPRELDAGVWLCERALLSKVLANPPRERKAGALLRALVAAALRRGPVATWSTATAEALAVVSRLDLSWAARLLRQRINHAHLWAGVTLEDPFTTLIEPTVSVGPDTTVGANVQLRGQTRIGPGVELEPNVIIIDSEIEAGARVRSFSHLEGARVRAGAIVGPYARLRPLADIGERAHVGNFVEVKKAVVETGAKANHLAYLGDARVGAGANVGAGTICCNYDGVAKHHTDIGRGVFIGSNSTLVAPIEIRDGAYVAAGSTLTQEVPPDALAFGRARQTNKPGLAPRIRQRNLARAGKS